MPTAPAVDPKREELARKAVAGDPDALPAVLEWLESGDDQEREWAARAMLAYGRFWQRPGIGSEQSDRWALALGRLIRAALYDSSETVRQHARYVLESHFPILNPGVLAGLLPRDLCSELGTVEGTRRILGVFSRESDPVRQQAAAAAALLTSPGAIAEEVVLAILDQAPLPAEYVRMSVTDVLPAIYRRSARGSEGARFVASVIRQHGIHRDVCALSGGACITARAREELAAIARSRLGDRERRAEALEGLLLLCDPAGLALLAEAESLGRLTQEYEPAIGAMARHDPEAFLRGWFGLARRDGKADPYLLEDCVRGLVLRKDMLPPLDLNPYAQDIVALLDGMSESGVRAGVEAIAAFRIRAAADRLADWIATAEDWDESLRAGAVARLAACIGDGDTAPLERCGRTRSRPVRRAAAIELTRRGNVEGRRLLLREIAIRAAPEQIVEMAAAVVASVGADGLVEALPGLFGELGSDALDGRARLAHELLRSRYFRIEFGGGERAQEALIEALAHPDPAVVLGAIGVVRDGAQVDNRVRGRLRAHLRSGERAVAIAAMAALVAVSDFEEADRMAEIWRGLSEAERGALPQEDRVLIQQWFEGRQHSAPR